jgi:PAS domain S-box-containing protein
MTLPARNSSAFFALIFTLTLTVLAFYYSRRSIMLAERARFDEISVHIQDAIQGRFRSYVNVLEQTSGLLTLQRPLSGQEFRHYIQNLNLSERHPGLQGIGYAPVIELKKLKSFENEIAKQLGHYRIWPAPTQDEALPVRYIEPQNGHNDRVLGFDILSESQRRQAVLRARDRGSPSMSGTTNLVQESNEDGKRAFVIVAPLYRSNLPLDTVADRRTAFSGIVYAAFRAPDLFHSIFRNEERISDEINFEIFFDEPNGLTNLLYVQQEKPQLKFLRTSPAYQSVQKIKVVDQTLALSIYSLPGFTAHADHRLPFLILFFGMALSIFLSRLFWVNERQARSLIKSENQLRLIADSLPPLISYLDRSGRYRFVNLNYERWFSQTRAQILGQTNQVILGAGNFQKVLPYFQKALLGEYTSFKTRLDVHGESRAVECTYIPDLDETQKVRGLVSFFNDITDRQTNEDEQKTLVEITTLLASSLSYEDGMVQFADLLLIRMADWCMIDILDENNLIRRVAVVAADPEKRIWAKAMKDEMPSAWHEKFKSGSALVIKSGEPQLTNDIAQDKLKEYIQNPRYSEIIFKLGINSSMVIPLKARGRSIGAISFFRSMPGHNYSTRDLHFAIEIARCAAQAIDNLRLFQLAQRANQAKDEFLATLSHELRTPMNIIMGWLEVLSTEPVDSETFRQALQTMRRNAELQVDLITDLLDISRIMSGKLRLHISSIDLRDVITTSIQSVEPSAKAKDIRITSKLPITPILIAGDFDRLQQAMWNLLSNAIKFTPKGGKVDIDLQETWMDEWISELGESSPTERLHQARITVTDSGEGIDAAFLPYVFERFRQEDGSMTRNHGGLGLGLSIVRYLVESHGGTITASSAGKGLGAKFEMTFSMS